MRYLPSEVALVREQWRNDLSSQWRGVATPPITNGFMRG